jgi:hypothetical protein
MSNGAQKCKHKTTKKETKLKFLDPGLAATITNVPEVLIIGLFLIVAYRAKKFGFKVSAFGVNIDFNTEK